jgi:hypothetical protein
MTSARKDNHAPPLSLGPSHDHFRATLGPPHDHFCATLGLSPDQFWALGAHTSSSYNTAPSCCVSGPPAAAGSKAEQAEAGQRSSQSVATSGAQDIQWPSYVRSRRVSTKSRRPRQVLGSPQ